MAQRRVNRQPVNQQAPKRLGKRLRRRAVPLILLAGGILFLWGAITVLWWSRDLPDPQKIEDRLVAESTKIFDRTGEHLLYEIGDINRTRVELDQISTHLRNATIAAEDDDFYEHHGLDLRGITRAFIVNLSGGSLQGGSTITQQLIKNSILTPERTIRRKVKEAVLALELEQRFSKDEILGMYLNEIPYGSRAYGVEAASQQFFGVNASNLTLAQSATLAALPKAPTYYSPYGSHTEDLKWRQEHILGRMADLGMVSREQADAAKAEELEFLPRSENINAPHFVFYVREQLEEEYGQRVVDEGGLRVITTLDATHQTLAEETLADHQERLQGLGASNGALVALDPKTGDILAMAGSLDYFNEDIDGNVNVSIRHRSPGSSIKPFIYAAAFDKGYTPETILVDALTNFGQGDQSYEPKNYDLAEHGPVTMRVALANSLNIPAVKALYLAGVNEATELARDMGMESLTDPERYGLSLVLGGGEVRLLDEVSAYGVFATDGTRFPHRAILKVDSVEETIFDLTEDQPQGEEVLEPQTARLTTNVLSDNGARALSFGTGSYLQLGARPVAAKTGTTQEFRDGWTMGFTPSLAVGVWTGNNDNTPMRSNAAGANSAAPIWNEFMRAALANTPIEQFVAPEPLRNLPHGVLRGEIPEIKGKWDSDAGIVYSADCPVAVGTPKTFQELHNILFYVRRDNPRGNPPANAEADPQFTSWERGIQAWRDQHNSKHKTNSEKPHFGDSLPNPVCGIESADDLPKVRITEPNTTILRNSPVNVKVEVDTDDKLSEVRFVFDGEEVARHNARGDTGGTYEATIRFPGNFSGRKTLVILAITEEKLIGRAHRAFIINPDDSTPAVTLHTPKDGQHFINTSFPQTIKVTATDASGIDYVDVLYTKDGESGTSRIGRVSSTHPSIPNRYEVSWPDSPGPGTYQIYAIAYDKTGNFKETSRVTVNIE